MKEFAIPLKKGCRRPMIELYKLPTIIDSVSVIPVFSLPLPLIEKFFDIKLILENELIEGFGGYEKGSVYSIKNFKIGELNFKDFEVFVPFNPRIRFPFLLSATLFYGMSYEIDTINEKFIVRMKDEQSFEREFKIRDLDGKLYPQIDGTLIQDIDIFLQDGYIFY